MSSSDAEDEDAFPQEDCDSPREQSQLWSLTSSGNRRRAPRRRGTKRKDYNVIKFRVHVPNTGAQPQTALPEVHILELDPHTLGMSDLAEPAAKWYFHRATSHCWPSFEPWQPEDRPSAPLIGTWLEQSNQQRLLLHAFVSGAGALMPDFPAEFHAAVARHRAAAIKAMLELSSPDDITEATLFAIYLLSHQTRPIPSEPNFGLFRPPLQKLQIIHVQRTLRFDEPHHTTITRLLKLRGGVRSIKLPYLAEVLQIHDLLASTLSLHPVAEPALCHSFTHYDHHKLRPYRETVPTSPDYTPSAFTPLRPLSTTLKLLLEDMRIYLAILSAFVAGLAAPSAKELAVHRNILQHRLLSLPPQQGDAVAEVVRLATAVFALGVTFPEAVWQPKGIALRQLEDSMRALAMDEVEEECVAVVFWAAMVGAMMAGGRGYFVEVLRNMVGDGLVRVRSWEETGTLLKGYLWLEEACEIGGMIVWERIRGWGGVGRVSEG